MVSAQPVLAGLASALPPAEDQMALWESFFASHFAGVRGARRIYASVKVAERHPAVNPIAEDISSWSTAARMHRYRDEAVPLAKEALSVALSDAGVRADEVGLLVVVSCTGFASPGLDVLVARDLGIAPGAERLLLGQLGCHAALPGLSVASDRVAVGGRPAAVVCVELSSLHLQPPPADPEQVVCHALFGDAAAAAVVVPGTMTSRGLEVLDRHALSDLGAADHLTWEVTDQGFRMRLSRELPRLIGRQVEPLVDELLARHGLARDEVAAWAVHPGGPQILDVVEARLGLGPATVAPARRVLAAYGNCSSPTTLLVLEEIRRSGSLCSGEAVVALAFGPGLSAQATLLRVR